MNNTSYKYKYLKYKNKYKKMKGGGCEDKIKEEIQKKTQGYDNLKKILSEECGYDTSGKTMEKDVNNLVDDKLNCMLVSNKCSDKYYNQTYNIDLKSHVLYKYIKNKDDFCVTKIEKCCNCIAISIYSKNPNVDLVKYIASICRTIKNVGIALPEWIVRVYMDVSVYNYIKLLDKEESKKNVLSEYIKLLTTSENTELYTYLCDYPENFQYSKLRIQRFYSLCSEDTNIVVIREADGIVSLQDCINIKAFAQSKKILYVLPFLGENQLTYNREERAIINKYKIYNKKSYQTWLQIYKNYIDYEYFEKKWNYYDILAGCFASKIKIKKEAFVRSVQYIQKSITTLYNNLVTVHNNKNIRIPTIIKKCYDDHIKKKSNHEKEQDKLESFKKLCYIGFDEMLLLNLFKNFVSVTYDTNIFLKNPDEVIVNDNSSEFRDIVDHIEVKFNVPVDIDKNYNCCMNIVDSMFSSNDITFNAGAVLGNISCRNMVSNIIYDRLLYNYVTNNKTNDVFYNVPCVSFSDNLKNSTLMEFVNIPYDSENGINAQSFDKVYDEFKIIGNPNIFFLYEKIKNDVNDIKSKINTRHINSVEGEIISNFFSNDIIHVTDNDITYGSDDFKPIFSKYIVIYEGTGKEKFNDTYQNFSNYDDNHKKIIVALFKIYMGEKFVNSGNFKTELFMPKINDSFYNEILNETVKITEYYDDLVLKMKNIENNIALFNNEYQKIYKKRLTSDEIIGQIIIPDKIVSLIKNASYHCEFIIDNKKTYMDRVFNISKLLIALIEYRDAIHKFNMVLPKENIKICSQQLDKQYESQI